MTVSQIDYLHRLALCRTSKRPLVREHNHRTGRLRFPICAYCNLAMGMLARARIRSHARLAEVGGQRGLHQHALGVR